MRSAAFFDMDRTLLKCNSGTLWIKFLRRRGELGWWKMLRAMSWIGRYQLAILDMEAVTALVIADMAGDAEQEMIEKCLAFTQTEVLPQVAPKALAAVASHHERGHLVAILTSSTPYVTEPLARHLGIEHVICTRLGIRDGKFDGTFLRPGCFGAGKVHWAEQFARAHDIDLARSFFYTDSYTDLPMLERVGARHVVNPDTRLRRHALQRGWPIEYW